MRSTAIYSLSYGAGLLPHRPLLHRNHTGTELNRSPDPSGPLASRRRLRDGREPRGEQFVSTRYKSEPTIERRVQGSDRAAGAPPPQVPRSAVNSLIATFRLHGKAA